MKLIMRMCFEILFHVDQSDIEFSVSPIEIQIWELEMPPIRPQSRDAKDQ